MSHASRTEGEPGCGGQASATSLDEAVDLEVEDLGLLEVDGVASLGDADYPRRWNECSGLLDDVRRDDVVFLADDESVGTFIAASSAGVGPSGRVTPAASALGGFVREICR